MTVRIDATEIETGGLTSRVRLVMEDEAGITTAEAHGLSGDSTALALVALVRAYCVSPTMRPRERQIAEACDRLTAALGRT